MKLTITKLLVFGALSSGCGALSKDQTLDIEMYGVAKSASTATGDSAPDFLTYRLIEVSLISVDGKSLTTLFNDEEEKTFRIIDRAQNIYSKSISDLKGESYSGIRLGFAPEVTGGNENYTDLDFTMAQSTLILTEAITVEKGQGIVVVNKVEWGNTILDGILSEPSYDLSVE